MSISSFELRLVQNPEDPKGVNFQGLIIANRIRSFSLGRGHRRVVVRGVQTGSSWTKKPNVGFKSRGDTVFKARVAGRRLRPRTWGAQICPREPLLALRDYFNRGNAHFLLASNSFSTKTTVNDKFGFVY